jgi:hypothetical protein
MPRWQRAVRRVAGRIPSGHAPLAAAGMLPERTGQPVKVWVHIPLAGLLDMDGSTTLVKQWVTAMRAVWAAHRAGACGGGGDIGAWLDGDAARAVACDAAMAPVVTGDVNVAALEDLVRLCARLDELRHGTPDGDDGDTGAEGQGLADAARAWEALEQAIIGKTTILLLHSCATLDMRWPTWPADGDLAGQSVGSPLAAVTGGADLGRGYGPSPGPDARQRHDLCLCPGLAAEDLPWEARASVFRELDASAVLAGPLLPAPRDERYRQDREGWRPACRFPKMSRSSPRG